MLLVVPPLIVIVSAFVVIGMAALAPALSNAMVSWLKDAGRVANFFLGPIVDLSIQLTRWITHKVGAEWEDLSRLGVTWLSGLYQWADLVVTNALEWPLWLWKVQRWLLFVELPKIVKLIPHAAVAVTHSIVTRVVKVERTVVRLPKLSKAAATALVTAAVARWIHPYLSMLRWLRAHFHALTAAIPRALPIPTVPAFPNLWKRVRRLEKLLAAGLGLAVVLRALGRLRLGWIRCNNWRTAGRAVCGFDPRLLESLLADGLTIFSVLSVVEFATELRKVEDEAVGIMGKLVREWPA